MLLFLSSSSLGIKNRPSLRCGAQGRSPRAKKLPICLTHKYPKTSSPAKPVKGGNLITVRETPPSSYGSQVKLPQGEEPNKLNPDKGINKSSNQQGHIPTDKSSNNKGGETRGRK